MSEREEVERLQREMDELEQSLVNVMRELSIHCDSRMKHSAPWMCEGALWECERCRKFNCALVGGAAVDGKGDSLCDKCWYEEYGEVA